MREGIALRLKCRLLLGRLLFSTSCFDVLFFTLLSTSRVLLTNPEPKCMFSFGDATVCVFRPRFLLRIYVQWTVTQCTGLLHFKAGWDPPARDMETGAAQKGPAPALRYPSPRHAKRLLYFQRE